MARILTYKVTTGNSDQNRTGNNSVAETHVIATDTTVTEQWIRSHPRTPKMNGPADGFPGFFWDGLGVKQTHRLIWELQCSATPFTFEPEADSPLAEKANITVDSELITEPTLFDADGNPIMTRAGEWIAGATRERPVLTYNVTKNLGSDPAWMDTHLGAINSDPVRLRGRTCAPFSLMLRRCSAGEYQTKNRVRFFVMSFSLHYDPQLWISKFPNRGVIEIVNVAPEGSRPLYKQQRIRSGSPAMFIQEPVMLDKLGRVIEGVLTPEADTPVDVTKLVVLEFKIQPPQKFTGVLPLK